MTTDGPSRIIWALAVTPHRPEPLVRSAVFPNGRPGRDGGRRNPRPKPAALDGAFRQTFGFTCTDGMAALKHLIDTAEVPGKRVFDVPFCCREAMIDGMSRNIAAAPEAVARFLAGFSLPVEKMREDGREIWKPKQEYRASRRGLFEFPHPTRTHLVWSREMARECGFMLTKGFVFQRVPPEWQSGAIDAALAALSNQAGKWFAGMAADNMARVGIVGEKSLKGIGRGDQRIAVPADVGELDSLGYHPGWRLLVLIECKMVDGATEPKYIRDDLSTFVRSDKAYAKKFRRKVEWVRRNLPAVKVKLEIVDTFDNRDRVDFERKVLQANERIVRGPATVVRAFGAMTPLNPKGTELVVRRTFL